MDGKSKMAYSWAIMDPWILTVIAAAVIIGGFAIIYFVNISLPEWALRLLMLINLLAGVIILTVVAQWAYGRWGWYILPVEFAIIFPIAWLIDRRDARKMREAETQLAELEEMERQDAQREAIEQAKYERWEEEYQADIRAAEERDREKRRQLEEHDEAIRQRQLREPGRVIRVEAGPHWSIDGDP